MMVDDVAPEALQIDDGKDTRLKSSSSPSSVSKTTNNIKENDNDEDAKYSLLMSLLIIHLPIELFISVAKFFLPLFGFLIELCFPYISKKKLRQMAKYSNQNPVLNDNDNENIPESIEHTEENNNDNKLQDTPNSELETGIDLLQKMQWQETENSDIQSTDRKKERSRIERFIHLLNKRLSAIAEKLKLKKPSNRAVVLSGATLSEVERQANSERSMNACSISGDIDNEALDNNSNKSGVSSIADDTNIVSALNTTSVSTVTNKSTYYDTMIPDHWRSKPILLEVKQPVSIHQSSQSVDNATSVRSRSNSALDSAKQLLGFKTSTDNSKRKSERTKKRKVNELDLKYKLMLDPRVNPNVRRSRRQEDFNLFLTVIVLIYCSVCGFDFSSRYCNWKYRAMIRYFNECNIKSIGQEVWSNILPTNLSDSSVFQILSSGFNTTFIDQKYINQIIVSQSLSLASTKQHIVAALKPILAGEVTFTDIKYAFWSQLEVLYSSMKTNEYVTRYSAVTYEYLCIVQNQLFSAIKYTQSSYRYIVVIIDGLKLKKVTLDDMLVSSNSTFNDHYFYCTEYFYYIRNQFIHSKYDITKLVYIKAIIRQLDQVMRMKAKSTVAFYKPILPSKTFANTTDTIDSVNLSAADMEYLALSPYNLQTILEIITCLVLIFMTYHRLCAYIILYTFRLVMSRSILFTGIFDVHCEWIAIRGMFPYFEVVIRNFIWRNPPQFKKTPYLLYCQHFRIQFNILDWYKTIRYGRKCKYGSVEVNTLDIFHEKVDRGTEEESLNLWVALGAEDSDSESAWLRLLFKTIWSSVRRKVMGVMLRNAMRGGRPSSDDEDEDAVDEDMAELRRLFNAHFDDDNESDAGSDTAQLETTDTDTNTSQQQGTANNLNKRLHSVGNMFGKRRNSKTSQQQISSTVCNRQNAPKFDFKDPFWSLMRILEARPMELESFLLQNFVMHPLSLIARFSSFSAQLATSNSTSFRIKLLLLNHRQMTGTDPKNKMGKRVALRPILFIDKVGEHLVKSVIMGNSMRLFTIAGAIGLQSAMRSLGYLKRMNESDGPDGINNVNSSGNGDNDDVNENLVSDNQSDTEELMSAVLGDVSESSQFGSVSPRTAQSFLESFRETDGLEIEMDSGSHRRVNISQNQGNSSMPSFKESTKSIQSIPPPSDVVRMSNKS